MESLLPEDNETSGPAQPSLRIEGNTIRISGKELPYYSGSVDYWRLDPQYWPKILDQIKTLGFQIISISIPWNVHEIASDLFDFGTTDKRRDLEAFLTLCDEKNLYVIVRPGPSVNAELAYFGFPKRIVYNPALQAQSSAGTLVIIPATPFPFPMPSYASDDLYDEISKFYDILCPILLRHLTPGGPIIGTQIDNELAYIFMHGPFSADYSPMAIRWYHNFLSGKYPSISVLNRAYRTRYNSFTEINPPRALATSEREALPRYFDWMEFQEYYIVLALSILASLMWARGIRGTITHHNTRSIYPQLPLNVTRTERELDIQGAGLYLGKEAYEKIRQGALYMSTASRLPFISECGMGVWPWGPRLSVVEQQTAIIVALMHGFRGFNIHMLVERNRWLGSPITQAGNTFDAQYSFLNRLLKLLSDIELHSLRRQVPVMLLRNLEYERLVALCDQSNWITEILGVPRKLLLGDQTFSYSETLQQAYPAFWEALYWGLTRTKVPFYIGDTEIDLPGLSQYPLIFLPTYDFMSDDLQQKIINYVRDGGTAVIGPEVPYLGSDMRGCTLLADTIDLQTADLRRPLVGLHDTFRIEKDEVHIGTRRAGAYKSYEKGKLIFLGVSFPPISNREDSIEAGEVVTQITQHLDLHPVGDIRAPAVDETYWGIRAPRIVFLANPTNQPQSVEVKIAQRARIRDAWTGEQLPQRGPQEVPLLPFATRILEVIR
jgi:beta-galactosidase